MKGTLIYLTSFIALNDKLKPDIIKLGSSYFCNTTICYPKDPDIFDTVISDTYENEKLEEDMNIIESEIKLNQISSIIYDYATNLLNNITYNQSLNYFKKYFPNGENECLMDVNLFVKIYAILSAFKFKEEARQKLMDIFHKSIVSNEICLEAMHIIKSLGDNLLNAHKLE